MIQALSRVCFILSLVAIEYLATTTIQIKPLEGSWDKLNHFIAFSTLYLLYSLGYKGVSDKIKVSVLIAFGLQIEIVQSFIPNRYFSLLDIVADIIGIAIGLLFYKMIAFAPE